MMYDIGVLEHLAQAAEKDAAVRIVCPLDDDNSDVAGWVARNAPGIRIMSVGSSKSTILLTDNREYFRAELREAGASGFSASIGFGFAIHSNSRPTVSSFRSFFELLWKSATLNEELKKADRMQKEFIDIAANELRTPIQPILGYAELLGSASGKSDEIEGIIRNALRLQRLTNDLLDTGKIESGSLKLSKEQFSLNETIADAIRDVNGHYENASIVHRHGGDTTLRADKHRIAQVVFNLLSNAAKFACSVVIESQTKDSEIAMTVTDDGPGIDPEIMPRLFTEFASKSEHGTGLGLYIAKAIVAAHGGTISAENNADRGATFIVTLPA